MLKTKGPLREETADKWYIELRIKSKRLSYLPSGRATRGVEKCKRSRREHNKDHSTDKAEHRLFGYKSWAWSSSDTSRQSSCRYWGKTQPGRHCRVFKGLSKKLGHGISKQQAPGILGEERKLARITKGNPGGSLCLGHLWAGSRIPGTDKGSEWPQLLAGTLWNLIRISTLRGSHGRQVPVILSQLQRPEAKDRAVLQIGIR